ncbi:MAG: hypothetical protein ABEJ84_01945 [Halodesulfurarchaeum sp.]
MALSDQDLERLGQVTGVDGPRVEPVSNERCPECRATISRTNSLGEIGHRPGCPRREERYHGRAGRRELGGGRVVVDE